MKKQQLTANCNFHVSKCQLMCIYICICFLVGQACGEAERDIQSYAGTASASRTGTQTDTLQTRGWEAKSQQVHEKKRWVHQPSGAGKRKVSASRKTVLKTDKAAYKGWNRSYHLFEYFMKGHPPKVSKDKVHQQSLFLEVSLVGYWKYI